MITASNDLFLETKNLLQFIYNEQVTGKSKHFPIGVFRSFRENKQLGYCRSDDNIFGTASTVFVLNQLLNYLSTDQQELVHKITKQARSAYRFYQNKDGLATYNFWKTNGHFPNGLFFRHFKHFKLPDDIDDTALIYLTSADVSEETMLWLKEKLTQHTGTMQPAPYSTWFGKTMPIEHDVCALCNLMYWIFENNLPLNAHDEATLLLLKNTILSGNFLKNPFRVARHYATVPLIVYHYTRLLDKFKIPQLDGCAFELERVIYDLLETERNAMNRVLLETSLLKLKKEKIDVKFSPTIVSKKDFTEFYSFIGALLAPYSGRFLGRFAAKKNTQINWKCEAHQAALLLENILLKNHYGNN